MHALSDHGQDKPVSESSPNRPAFTGRAGRPPLEQRCFTSAAVEARIEALAPRITHPELARLFRNCYPNTLDTTVTLGGEPGSEDTFVITGDIPAMWLRDSTAQTLPYVDLAPQDESLRRLFRGLLCRQAACVLLDPYANAFYRGKETGEFRDDETEMKPGVHERKWEIDSLCYPLRLAHAYWRATTDRAPFDARWLDAG
jgi:meiotically up-regulated gene 157 (Mug157) protein